MNTYEGSTGGGGARWSSSGPWEQVEEREPDPPALLWPPTDADLHVQLGRLRQPGRGYPGEEDGGRHGRVLPGECWVPGSLFIVSVSRSALFSGVPPEQR